MVQTTLGVGLPPVTTHSRRTSVPSFKGPIVEPFNIAFPEPSATLTDVGFTVDEKKHMKIYLK